MSRVRPLDWIARSAFLALLTSVSVAFGNDEAPLAGVAAPAVVAAPAAIAAPAVVAAPVTVAAAAAVAAPAPDVATLLKEIRGDLKSQSKRLDDLTSEVNALKRAPVNFTISNKPNTFAVRSDDCPPPGQQQQQGGAQPCQQGGAGGNQDCKDQNCKTTWVDATRLCETWVDSYKRVTVKRQTPYIELCNEWDPRSCCWRQTYVTRYREENHEVIVPYKEKVIREVHGVEKMTVCIDNLK